MRKLWEQIKWAIAGASMGANVLTSTAMLTAASAAWILWASQAVEAQEALRTNFSTYREAQKYADEKGYVMVHTRSNGTVFISQSSFAWLQSAPEFKVRLSGTGINYVTSVRPNTKARIADEVIIGWGNARIDIEEARRGGRENERGRDANTWTDTGAGNPSNGGGTGGGWNTGGETSGCTGGWSWCI